MFEMLVNVPFETVICGPDSVTPPNPSLYLGAAAAPVNPIATRIGTTRYYTVRFTPPSTGIYSLFAWDQFQLRAQCFPKSLFGMVKNLEDDALGSWSWDKVSGTLTILRQDGTVLATHKALDTLISASRERIS